MIVALSAVRVMQVAGDDIVDVFAGRKSIVTAVGPVPVPASVPAAGVAGYAPIGIQTATR